MFIQYKGHLFDLVAFFLICFINSFKVNDLSEASKSIYMLPVMMDDDIKADCVRKAGSHTRNLLRVKRGIDMVKVLFEHIISSQYVLLSLHYFVVSWCLCYICYICFPQSIVLWLLELNVCLFYQIIFGTCSSCRLVVMTYWIICTHSVRV